MNEKASELLGEPVIAGVILEAKSSLLKAIGSGVGGIVGGLLAEAAAKPASLPGDHPGIHYVAVGPTKVGFFAMKRGFFRPSLDRLLVQYPRSEVQAVEIEGGFIPTVHFVLRDGTHYALACPRIRLGKLKKVRELLVSQ